MSGSASHIRVTVVGVGVPLASAGLERVERGPSAPRACRAGQRGREPPSYAQRLFDARKAGTSDQEMSQIIPEGLKEIYFQDGRARYGTVGNGNQQHRIISIRTAEQERKHDHVSPAHRP
ncbi:hypothetical protein ACIQK5_37435 [Streptomyces virginiae]|uniref:hypothetical protein n=1 Tax=Streptomyces virginiae TaxID=1961 RepID=UPI0036EEC51A